MKVLDLFCGLRGWSHPWLIRGHETFGIDNNEMFEPDALLDIRDTTAVMDSLPWMPDVVLASPPCQSFSMMSVGKHWTPEGEPKSQTAVIGRDLVLATLRIIVLTRPLFCVIENPRARLRSLNLLDGIPRYTVTYCQYGEVRMKPTDLWGILPADLELKPMCKNGDPCHIAAPRGSRTGTQGGVDSIRSAMIPFELSLAICMAVEDAIQVSETTKVHVR